MRDALGKNILSIIFIGGMIVLGITVLVFWRHTLSSLQLITIFFLIYVLGGTLGEVVTHSMGVAGHAIAQVEDSRWYTGVNKFLRRYARYPGAIAVSLGFINALTPIGFFPAVSGIIAGTEKYSVLKFTIATMLGRSSGTLFAFWILQEVSAFDFFCRMRLIKSILGNICT